MEKSDNKTCTFMPHFCNAGMEAPKSVVKPERKITQQSLINATSDNQKPWSIFGDVYWI